MTTAAQATPAEVQRRRAVAARRILARRPAAPVRSDEALVRARQAGRP